MTSKHVHLLLAVFFPRYADCLEDEREDYQNCSVLYCATQLLRTVICTLIRAVLTDELF